MNRRERLNNILRGKIVDRPGVNFYEVGGFVVNPDDQDEFNIYNSASWRPLLDLAEAETDIIRMCFAKLSSSSNNPGDEYFSVEQVAENSSKFTKTTLRVSGKIMTSLTRVDKNIDTVWTLEHLCKSIDDLEAYLTLPYEVFDYQIDVSGLIEEEYRLGDKGIVMVDLADPLCMAAGLFSMADFTIIAMTEKKLFNELLEKLAVTVYQRVEKISTAFSGHLWRIFGPEYATPPYLPPDLFEEYVVKYDKKIVELIHKYNGYARIHCHGKIRSILPLIITMGADAIDPIEPPPQGDVELFDVRKEFGKDIVLFGNLEIADIENLEPSGFEKVVKQTLKDGTSGSGRGFVLMPSASPYGREISKNTMDNYKSMINLLKQI